MPRRRHANAPNARARGGNGRRPPIRFAVIGQGHFAQSAILPAFKHADGCALQAIFSDDETKLRALKRKYGVAAALGYGQYVEYLHSHEVDAVYIALPNDMHAEYAVHAARAGIHVLCEKPLAVNPADAERIAEACAENRVRLMVAYRLHFEAANLEAVERIKRGDIGRPRYFSSTFSMQVREGDIRTQRERGGGPLLDIGIYCVNAARNLFRAEPVSVVALSARTASDPRFQEVDEQVSAVLRFPDDRLAQLTCAFGAHDCAALSVVGDKGSLTLDPAYEHSEDLVLETQIGGRKPSRKVFKKRDQVAAELVAFARYVRLDKQPEPSGEEGIADLRVLDAIQRSLDSGRVEKVDIVRRTQRPSKKQDIRRPPHGMPELIHVEPPSRS
jgi:predicted dehydrogenase